MFKLVFTILLVVLTTGSAAVATVPPLLDRDVFFGDPEISGGQLSPDGTYLSFLRPYEGTRNIWIKDREADFSTAIPVTARTDRPISGYAWSIDGQYLLYAMDRGGNENFNIYALDPAEASDGTIPEARNITDLEGVTAGIIHVSHQDPDILFVAINDRDPSWHDLYELSISTGDRTLIQENEKRYTGWYFDWDDRLRLATRSLPNGDNELWRVDPDTTETLIYQWSVLETASPLLFHQNNEHVYFVSNTGDAVDKLTLYLLDINSGEKVYVESDPEERVDFANLWLSEETKEILATFYIDDRTRVYFRDEDLQTLYQNARDQLGDVEIAVVSATKDDSFWLIAAYSDVRPSSVYVLDTKTHALTYQYTPLAGLPPEYMSSMQPIRYPSSDGMEIPAYLTLPRGFGETDLPLVVMPHGGPWARDTWGFNTYVQFLANRGYAVLQPNFRGSTGYGQAFLDAGNRQWGDLMQDDLTWGVKYLVEAGTIDPERIGIFGGSYGGYAALAGLAFTPDIYAAGVSLVGPSNLLTLLNSIPPYWESARIVFHERMGDPTTPEGEARLIRQSPLYSADQIQAPLLVAQGQNDPRVAKAESDQIVVALRDRGFPVEYLNAPDEGHGFARPENNMAFVATLERFLAEHLGGRYQKEIPADIAARLEEITVDVRTVTLPEKLSQDNLSMLLAPVRPLAEGTFSFEIRVPTLNMQWEMTVQVRKKEMTYVVEETSFLPMGEITDRMVLDAASLNPLQRTLHQEPVRISMEYGAEKVAIVVSMDGQKTTLDVTPSGSMWGDGPANYLQLATLPLQEGYTAIFRSIDLNTLQEVVYRLQTSAINTEEGADAWLLQITPEDGSPGKQQILIEQGTYRVLRFSATIPELGGAEVIGQPLDN